MTSIVAISCAVEDDKYGVIFFFSRAEDFSIVKRELGDFNRLTRRAHDFFKVAIGQYVNGLCKMSILPATVRTVITVSYIFISGVLRQRVTMTFK